MEVQLTAREMFEKLGYEYEEDTVIKRIIFRNGSIMIAFYKEDKTFYKQYGYEPGDITLEELKAINKQIEELHRNE